MKKSYKLQRKYVLLTLFLLIIFIFVVQNCFSFGFLGCYGPGCSKDWCNSKLFIPLLPFYAFYVLFLLFPIHWFIQVLPSIFGFNIDSELTDKMGFVISHFFMIPVFFITSLVLIKTLQSIYSRLIRNK